MFWAENLKNYSINFLFLYFVIFVSSVMANPNCPRKQTLQNFQTIIENQQSKIEMIEKALGGQTADRVILTEIFGVNFNLDQTTEKIKALQSTIHEHGGVAPENKGVLLCLVQLKKQELADRLKDQSTKLRELEIKLLETNRKFSDSLRESGEAEGALPDLKDKIDSDSRVAANIKQELENTLVENQKEVLNQADQGKKELLSYINELTKIKIALLEQKIRINRSLEDKIIQFEKSSENLGSLANSFDHKNRDELRRRFENVQALWLTLKRENFYELFNTNGQIELPKVPEIPAIHLQ